MSVDQLGQAMSGTAKKTNTLVDRFKMFGQYRIVSEAFMYIRTAAYAALSAITDFDQGLKNLQAITGATNLQVEQLGNKIIDVASKTKFSIKEVADGMVTLGQAGYTATEAMETMQAVSDLATGTLSDMNSTVDLVTTTMRVFGIESSRSGELVDIFANAVNKSKLTVDKIRTSMQYIGPIAKEAGISFKELSATTMTLANSGLRASKIGTGLRTVFAQLVDPSTKVQMAMKKAGLSMSDLDPKVNSLSYVIRGLDRLLKTSGDAFDLFGKRGATAVLALVKNQGVFDEMLDKVGESGTAAKMAAKQMEGLGLSFKNLKDKLGVFATAMGKAGIADAMKGIIDVIRTLTTALTALVNNDFVSFMLKVTLMTTTILVFVGGLKMMGSMVIAKIAPAMILFGNKVLMLTNYLITGNAAVITFKSSLMAAVVPLGTIFLAITAIIGVFYIFNKMTNASKEAAKELLKMASAYDTLTNKINGYRIKLATLDKDSEEATEANKDLREELFGVAKEMPHLSKEIFNVINSIDPLTGKINDSSTALKKLQEEIAKTKLKDLIDGYKESQNALEQGSGVIDSVKTAYQSLFEVFTTEKSIKELQAFQKATSEFSIRVMQGNVSLKEMEKTMQGWRGETLTQSMINIQDNMVVTKTVLDELVQELLNANKITLQSTDEELRSLGERSKMSEIEIQNLIDKINDLRDGSQNKPINIIEKIETDGSFADQIGDFKKYVDAIETGNAQLESSILDSEKNKAMAYDASLKKLVDRYKKTKALYDSDIAEAGKNKARVIQIETSFGNYQANWSKRMNAELTKIAADGTMQKLKAKLKAEKVASDALRVLNESGVKQAGKYGKRIVDITNNYTNEVAKIKSNYKSTGDLLSNAKIEEAIIKNSYGVRLQTMKLSMLKGKTDQETYLKDKQDAEIECKEAIENVWTDAYANVSDAEKDNSASKTMLKKKLDSEIDTAEEITDAKQEELDKQNENAKDAFEKENKLREVILSKTLKKITKLEKKGAKSSVDATKEREESTLKMYAENLKAAQDYFDEVSDLEGTDEYEKRLDKLLDASEKYYDKESDALNDYYDSKKDIEDQIVELNTNTAKSIKDIQKNLYDSLKDLEKERVQNKKDGVQEILNIEQKGADALRAIDQRGMTDKEKEIDNERAAQEKLKAGLAAIAKARTSGDAKALASGQDLINQSLNLSKGLADEGAARDGINDAIDALKGASKIKTEIEDRKKLVEQQKLQAKASAEIKKKEEETAKTAADLLKLLPKKINLPIEITGTENLKKVEEDITKINEKSKSQVKLTVNVGQAMSGLKNIKDIYDKIKDKVVTIIVKYKEVNKPAELSIKKADGGIVKPFANGGGVFSRLTNPFISKGSGTKDDVPAMLMQGEYVIKRSSVAKYGKRFMSMLNQGLIQNVPKFADGGVVTDIGDKVSSSLRGTQLALTPNAPFKHGNTFYNISSPSFYNSTEKKISNIKSFDGKQRASSLVSSFAKIVPGLQSGGGTELLSQFHVEKNALIGKYDDEIKLAKETKNEEIAFLLEMEQIQLQELANELSITLQQVRLDFEATKTELTDSLDRHKQEMLNEKTETETVYRDSLLNIRKERVATERMFATEERILQNKKQRTVNGIPSSVATLQSINNSIVALQIDNKKSSDSADTKEKVIEIEKLDNAKVEKSNQDLIVGIKQKLLLVENDQNDQMRKKELEIKLKADKVVSDTALSINKIEQKSDPDVLRLKGELQAQLLDLRKQYDYMIQADFSSDSNHQPDKKYWLNKGGFVGFPRGKKKREDSVRAMLTPGEFVINEGAVNHYGLDFIESLNKKEFGQADFPQSKVYGFQYEPSVSGGKVNHINATSFHLGLQKKTDKFQTALGMESAKNITGIFKEAVPHLAEGGDIGDSQAQMATELSIATQKYSELISFARSSGEEALAHILETEQRELVRLQKELTFTLKELKVERDTALNKILTDYISDESDLTNDYNDDIADLKIDKKELQDEKKEAKIDSDDDIDDMEDDAEDAKNDAVDEVNDIEDDARDAKRDADEADQDSVREQSDLIEDKNDDERDLKDDYDDDIDDLNKDKNRDVEDIYDENGDLKKEYERDYKDIHKDIKRTNKDYSRTSKRNAYEDGNEDNDFEKALREATKEKQKELAEYLKGAKAENKSYQKSAGEQRRELSKKAGRDWNSWKRAKRQSARAAAKQAIAIFEEQQRRGHAAAEVQRLGRIEKSNIAQKAFDKLEEYKRRKKIERGMRDGELQRDLTESLADKNTDLLYLKEDYNDDLNDNKIDLERINTDYVDDISDRNNEYGKGLVSIKKSFDREYEQSIREQTRARAIAIKEQQEAKEEASSISTKAVIDYIKAQEEIQKARVKAEKEQLKYDNEISKVDTENIRTTRDYKKTRGELLADYFSETKETHSDYTLGAEKANLDYDLDKKDVVRGAAHDYSVRLKEMNHEIKILEIEMAQELFEIKKKYSNAGEMGVKHFLNKGGFVNMFPDSVKGKDSVSAMLTPGEFVIREDVVKKFGQGFFNKLNNFQMPKYFAEGGVVGDSLINNTNNSTEILGSNELLGTVNLQVGKNNYPMNTNVNLAKQLITDFKRMGLSIA